MNGQLAESAPSNRWLIAFLLMAIISIVAAVFIPDQNAVQQFYFRVVVAISMAGISAIIPGFLHIELSWLKNSIRAGGAIAIFVLIYAVNPAEITNSFRPTVNLSGEWNFFLQSNNSEIPGGVARIDHRVGENVYIISGDVPVNPDAPEGAYNSPTIIFDSDYSLITDRKIVFHYRTNQGEEGVAVANYSGSEVNELYFNFRDFDETNDDNFPSGVLIFRRVSL